MVYRLQAAFLSIIFPSWRSSIHFYLRFWPIKWNFDNANWFTDSPTNGEQWRFILGRYRSCSTNLMMLAVCFTLCQQSDASCQCFGDRSHGWNQPVQEPCFWSGGGWHFQFLSSARVLMIQFHPISSFQVMIMRIHAVKPTINFQFWLFIPHYTTHFSWKWGWFMARLSSAWGSPLAFPPPFSCQILGAPGEHAPST